MFEIKVANSDVSNGSVAVSWCLDIETINALREEGATDPQVVIITAPVNNYSEQKEYRQIVPLKDLIAYVEFRSPGENNIWAFILNKSSKLAKNMYGFRVNNKYVSPLLNSEGVGWGLIFFNTVKEECKPKFSAEPIKVSVPEGVFAPEPSELEKAWVNYLFSGKSIDQCEFRRRRAFAYTIQPVLILLKILFNLIMTTLALIFGARDFSLKYLLHPLIHDLDDVTDLFVGGTIFIRNLDRGDYKNPITYTLMSCWTLIFFPPVAAIIILIIASGGGMVASITIGIFASLIFIIFGLDSGVIQLMINQWQENYNNRKYPAYWYIDKEEIDLLTCGPNKKPLTFSTLPSKKKTLRLRISDLKSKVCRPFSA